jgi:hypothetical protein
MKVKSLLIYSFIVASCAPKQELKINNYFDIKGFFTNQIGALEKEKPKFAKQILINKEKETKDLTNIDWKKELDPYLQTDINKVAYAQSYETIENDSMVNYTLKPSETLPVKFISIKKSPKTKQIISITIESSDENLLYYWKKSLLSTFENGRLKNYRVSGRQKILIFDEEAFIVEAERK